MKSIIPFEKEIIFKNNIQDITSISLEHQLNIDKLLINGYFIISGDYKVSSSSNTVEKFYYKIPVEINVDDKYNTEKAEIDIDDFYYEVIDNSILKIYIDVSVNKLEEIKEIELSDIGMEIEDIKSSKEERQGEIIKKIVEHKEEIEEVETEIKEKVIEQKTKTEEIEKDNMNSLFNNMDNNDIYISYNVYIVREGDTIESILEKYSISEELLKQYNNLSDIKIGDKIIIPNN